MGYAVLHLEKASGTDSAMSAHIERTFAPKNANPALTHLNRELIEFSDGVHSRTEAIQHRLDTAGVKRKIGKNQVRAVRILLTGSPKDMKQIEREGRLDEWCNDNVEWMKQTYGSENIVSAVLHLDESTPHIHATLVPIVIGERRKAKKEQADTSKKNYRKKDINGARLCADDVMSRARLKNYQNSYAEKMADYGLERGIEGSEAKHIKTSHYYRDLLNQTEDIQENIDELQKLREQAEEELVHTRSELKIDKIKNAATETTANIVESVGSLFGNSKIKNENERLKQYISELKVQVVEREQRIKQIELQHQTEKTQFSEYINKLNKFFPYIEKLLPLVEYCKNTLRFSDEIIRELCKLRKLSLRGKFYSIEFNCSFESDNAVFSFEKDKNSKECFHICVNGVDLVLWFRDRMNEIRERLNLKETVKNSHRGLKL